MFSMRLPRVISKRSILIFLGLFFAFILIYYLINRNKERNILFNEFKVSKGSVDKSLNDVSEWRNRLRQQIEENLSGIPQDVRDWFIDKAYNETESSWPSLLASQYLEFVENGNRYNFEVSQNKRRVKLVHYIIGEMLEGNGEFMNQIVDGLWLILEESTWVLPAHLSMQSQGFGLPDPAEFVIDLGAGEWAAFISWIKLVIGEELANISPVILKRIDYELDRRIIRPFLDNSHMHWMGFNGRKVNNWNVWINTNILTTALLAVDNQYLRYEVIEKAIQSVDKFLNGYPNDGGCDEGPTYWVQAGGRLIEFIDLLSSFTNYELDWSENAFIQSIGTYIYKIHIDYNRFVNFGDSFPFHRPDPIKVLKYGILFKDPTAIQFASYLYSLDFNDDDFFDSTMTASLNEFFETIAFHKLLKTIPPKAPLLAESWLPDLQVVTLRSQEGSANGLFLGAKAGTNHENHNHNDVGNFVLYVNGFPAIIDVGVGTYTAQTFSEDRYKLWYMQSQWHNTPTINGVQQHDGIEYMSHNVKYTKLTNGGEFEADISGAYPKEADVESWVRKFTFDRSLNTINLEETYELNKFVEPFMVHFITILNETHADDGQIILNDKNISLMMQYDYNMFEVEVDKPEYNDERILKAWGDRISRITLTSKSDSLKGKFNTIFRLNSDYWSN